MEINCTVRNQSVTDISLTSHDFTRLIGAILFLQTAIGIVGNSLIITIILKYKKLQTSGSYILLTIAAADILLMLTIPLNVIPKAVTIECYEVRFILCYVAMLFAMLGGYMNVSGISVSAIDRFVALKYPFYYRFAYSHHLNEIVEA